MKRTTLVGALLAMILLCGCGSSYPLNIESGDITRTPNLMSEMQVVDFNEDNGDLMFQEISEDENDALDTLIIAYDNENMQNTKIGLSAYVQSSINQLKDLGTFKLSNEKSEKKTIGEHQAILKTYNIKDDTRELSVAQEFVELDNRVVVMISYTSDESSHVKRFVKQLSTLTIN